jgi:hypothetical protein
MTEDQREIRHKKRVLEYAKKLGNINAICRRFGIARSTFYLWRNRYRELARASCSSVGEMELVNLFRRIKQGGTPSWEHGAIGGGGSLGGTCLWGQIPVRQGKYREILPDQVLVA